MPIYVPGKVVLSQTSYPDIRNGIVTNGLVLNLDAGQTASYPGTGTTWTDLSGNGNNGTLVNGPTYSSANGGSLAFNGTTQWTNIPTVVTPIPSNGSFTVSMWFNFNNYLDNAFASLFDAGNLGGNPSGFCLAKNNTNNVYVAVNTGFKAFFTIFSNNIWYNIVATAAFGAPYDLNLYINGQLAPVASSATTSTLTASGANYGICRRSSSAADYRAGSVGAVYLYNRALTAAEVQQNFNCLRMRYGI